MSQSRRVLLDYNSPYDDRRKLVYRPAPLYSGAFDGVLFRFSREIPNSGLPIHRDVELKQTSFSNWLRSFYSFQNLEFTFRFYIACRNTDWILNSLYLAPSQTLPQEEFTLIDGVSDGINKLR